MAWLWSGFTEQPQSWADPAVTRFCQVLAGLVMCASCLPALALQMGETKTEHEIRMLGSQVAELVGGVNQRGRDASDARLQALLERAQRVWQTAPANSANVKAFANATGYEMVYMYSAVADYYIATRRKGLALDTLARAAEEARRLRYYDHWQNLTLRLIDTCIQLGLYERARLQLYRLEKFMRRIGFKLESYPAEITRDAVIIAHLRTIKLRLGLDNQRTPDQIEQDADYVVRLIEEAPEAWGWSVAGGYAYTEELDPYITRLIQLGNRPAADRLAARANGYWQYNQVRNPIKLVKSRGDLWLYSLLARDVSKSLGTLSVDPRMLGSLAKPEVLRYKPRTAFLQQLNNAKYAWLQGDPGLALARIESARKAFDAAANYYRKLDAATWILDDMPSLEMTMLQLEAGIRQDLGQHQQAYDLYESVIAWAESERNSLRLDERIYFFRGRAAPAYEGSNQSALDIYLATRRTDDLARFLANTERMRSRQFRDMVGQADLRDASKIPIDRLQQQLDEDSALLIVTDLPRSVALVVITRQTADTNIFKKPAGFNDIVFRIRNSIAGNGDASEELRKLSRQVFGPLADTLAARHNFYMVNDGALSSLPPSTLFAGEHQIGDLGPVTLVPSLSLWHRAQQSARQRQRLLVVADPVYNQKKSLRQQRTLLLATRGSASLDYFPPLPETRDEANAILAQFVSSPDNTALFGADATESNIKALGDLAGYSNLHFATHGIISGDLPNLKEPALVLAWEKGEDGFLTATEVAGLKLDADLTVLSACNTGNGEYFMGEGLMGIGRAFMVAGSKSVVASLWPVESESTRLLMVDFYEGLARGLPEAEALWRAQQNLRQRALERGGESRGINVDAIKNTSSPVTDYSHPFYWSPFVLISSGAS